MPSEFESRVKGKIQLDAEEFEYRKETDDIRISSRSVLKIFPP